MIELVFLGTSSAFPTKKRNHPSVFLRYEGDRFLFDCGEGTQRQLTFAGKSPIKIDSILLTHWHGDHSLGLAGITQSSALQERKRDLPIFGPKNTNEKVKRLLKIYPFALKFRIKTTSLDCKKPETIIETEKYEIKALNISHRVKTLAYSFRQKDKRKIDVEYTKQFGLVNHPKLGKLQEGKTIKWEGKEITPEEATYIEKGKKISYIGDGRPGEKVREFVKGSDILICEATFSADMEEEARESGHLTTKEAARFAKEAKAKKLFLSHFSRRYRDKDIKKLKKEAKGVFKNVEMAEDLMKVELKT